MATLVDAVGFLERGDWQAAHEIAQCDPSELGSWAHGIVHLLEGDFGNAAYWYRRAGRAVPDASRIAEEIAELKQRLESR